MSEQAERSRLLAAQGSAASFYQAQLSTDAGAGPSRFLAGLGIPVDGAWVIGWAPDRSTALVNELRRGRFSDQEILASGLARTTARGQLVDRFRDRVMVGIRDGSNPDAPVVGFTGYAPPGAGPHVRARVYSSSVAIYRPEATLFGVSEQQARAGRQPILAAHPLDAIVLSERTASAALPPLVIAPAGQRLTRRHVTMLEEVADLSAGIGLALRLDADGRRAAAHAYRMLAPVVGEHNILAANWVTGLEHTRPLAEALGIAPADHTVEIRSAEVAPAAPGDESTRSQSRVDIGRSPTQGAEGPPLDLAGDAAAHSREAVPAQPSSVASPDAVEIVSGPQSEPHTAAPFKTPDDPSVAGQSRAVEGGPVSTDPHPRGVELPADADSQLGAATESNTRSLPDRARPVQGVTGYHYASNAGQITVYGPDNAPIATLKGRGGALTAGEVGGVRIPGAAYGPDEFAPLAARQHRTTNLAPEQRDRVSVDLLPDSSAKAGFIVAVHGIAEDDPRDRAAIDGVVTFRWSRKHNAFVTGRAWNPATVDKGFAYLLTTFGRQGRHVLVTQAGVGREQDLVALPERGPPAQQGTHKAAAATDPHLDQAREDPAVATDGALSAGTTESVAPFTPVEAARIRVAVEDHAAWYFGGPLGLGRDDAARYVSEGHLKGLVDKYGLREVWDGVAAQLEVRPELLERDEAERGAVRAAREERATAASRDALAAYKAGDLDGVGKALDAGELIDPDYHQGAFSWDRARDLIERHQQEPTIAAVEASDGQSEPEPRKTMSNLRDTLIARFELTERTDNYPDRPHADLWEGSGVNPSISDFDEGVRRLEGILPREADWPEQWAGYPYRVVWRVPSERMHVTHCEGDVSVLVARSEEDFAAIDASADMYYGSREAASEQGSEASGPTQTTPEADGPEAAAQPNREKSNSDRTGFERQQSRSYADGLITVHPGELGPGIGPNAKTERLKREILESRKVMPIEVAHDGFIVDGEHRYKALCDLGVQEIPAFVGTQLGASGRLERPYSGLRLPVEIPPRGRENAIELAQRGVTVVATEALEESEAAHRPPSRRSEYDSGFEM